MVILTWKLITAQEIEFNAHERYTTFLNEETTTLLRDQRKITSYNLLLNCVNSFGKK